MVVNDRCWGTDLEYDLRKTGGVADMVMGDMPKVMGMVEGDMPKVEGKQMTDG